MVKNIHIKEVKKTTVATPGERGTTELEIKGARRITKNPTKLLR
jgi:hypothetical protein